MTGGEYEGLERTGLESPGAAATPHQYAGLADSPERHAVQGPAVQASHSPTEYLDQHGYLHVLADPDHADQTEVSTMQLLAGL